MSHVSFTDVVVGSTDQEFGAVGMDMRIEGSESVVHGNACVEGARQVVAAADEVCSVMV